MNRYPIDSRQFLVRLRVFALALAVIQFFHLAIFAEARAKDFVAWLVVNLIIQVSLWVLRVAAGRSKSFVIIPWRPLVTLLLLTFAFKMSSRVPYISSSLTEGLYATRTNIELGTGGAASYFNIFFYPLAILLAFTVLPRRAYLISMSAVILVCLVDFAFLGTRNAPAFVLLFHLLSAPVSFKPTAKHVGVLILLVVGFIGIFSYSTINRSWDSTVGQFDWLNVFEFTGSTQILKINRSVALPLSEQVPAVLPAIFLSHYLSHPVAELAHLVDIRAELDLGGMYYISDQFCVIGICSREDSMWAIESTNPRAGVYQTIFASLFFDFGMAGAALVWVISLFLISLWQLIRPNQLSIGVAFMSVVIVLGPIENYLYNGLGLIQIFTLFFALFVIQLFGRLTGLMPKFVIPESNYLHRPRESYAHPIC